MADQRPQFRFRLPWLSMAATPRPTVESQPPRPTVETLPPTQPTTTPAQRPPFRPPGIAPAQPPTLQAQAPPRTEPPPRSPPRAATEFQTASQPASPSRATTQARGASLPPSPSRGITESRVTSQPASPSRAITQTRTSSLPPSPSRAATQSQAASVPPSPSRTASKTEPALQTAPLPQSPLRLAPQPTGRTPSRPSPSRSATQVQPAAGAVSQPPKGMTPQPDGVATQPTEVLGAVAGAERTSTAAPETYAPPHKIESKTISAEPKPLPGSERTLEETEERSKVVQEFKKEKKANGPASEVPMQRTITELLSAASDSGRQTRDLLIASFQAEQKQQKQEILDEKKEITSSSNGEKIKIVSPTHPNDRRTISESQKHVTSNGEQASLHKEIREDISKLVHKLATGHPKQLMEGKPVSIITLTGENRGASLHLGFESAKKEGLVHIHRGYKINPDESLEATTDGEGTSKARKFKDPITKEDLATRAYINSNIQSINNSICLNSYVNERNPGVQLVLSRNIAESIKSNTKPEALETREAFR